MGMFMGIDDMYIEGMLEVLNLRFGVFPNIDDKPDDKLDPDELVMQLNVSGVREVQQIQADVELFKAGRPLVQSMRALGIAGPWNNFVRRKWFKLLNQLEKLPSSTQGVTSGQAIVAALIAHLDPQNQDPDPVHFKAHDGRNQQGGAQVLITPNDRPIFYIDRTFLTISIPMAPRSKVAAPPGP